MILHAVCIPLFPSLSSAHTLSTFRPYPLDLPLIPSLSSAHTLSIFLFYPLYLPL